MVLISNIGAVGGLVGAFPIFARDRTLNSITRLGTRLQNRRLSGPTSNAVVLFFSISLSTSSSSGCCDVEYIKYAIEKVG